MGFLVKGIKSVFKVVGKVVGSVVKVVGGIFGFAVGGKSSKTKGTNNLNKSLDPEAYRKIVFGKVAAPLDVRYWEIYGTNGQYFDEIIVLASHRINSIQELYFEEKLGFDAAGIVQSPFVGVVSRDTRLGTIGQTAINTGGGTQYGTSSGSTFDGCPIMKLVWVPDEKKLPNGIIDRYTQIIEGALVYDPRRDSTVPGGSGSHRANDRSTWTYATLDANGVPIGRNNALQTLWYLLGWVIPTKDGAGTVTGEMLVCGRGVDPADINMQTFVAGSNACETAGYYTDLVLSTEDTHTDNEDKITANGLIGRLIDPGGLWSYYANVNDTANVAVYLTDADIVESSSLYWEEYKGMSEQYNQVRGKFIYPVSPVLFQPFPYPMVRDATYEANLGVKRVKPLDFEQVLDSTLAQRLARLFLNEGQYQGELNAPFNYRAVNAQAWSVVSYTSERFGFTKLFRVWRQNISTENGVQMLLKEIHSSIWTAGTVTAPLAPGLGLNYQANQEITVSSPALALHNLVAPNGSLADGFRLSWAQPSLAVRRTEARYKLNGTSFWTTIAPVERDILSVIIDGLFSGAFYDIALRHVSVNEVPGPWTNYTNTSTGTTGNVNNAAIAAAGGTAVWTSVTSRPANLVSLGGGEGIVTVANTAAGITGQGSLATLSSANWSTQINTRPVELTDGRITAGIDASGDLARNVTTGRADSSNILRRTAGGLYSGDLAATFGDNIVLNSQMLITTSNTWWGSATRTAGVAASNEPQWYARSTSAGGQGGSFNNGDLVPVVPGETIFCSGLVRQQTASTNSSWTINPFFYKADGTTFISQIIANLTANNTAWVSRSVSFVVPAASAFMTVGFTGFVNIGSSIDVAHPHLARTELQATIGARSGTNIFRTDGATILTQAEIRTLEGIAASITGQAITATDSNFAGLTGSTKPENNADVTSTIEGAAEVIVLATSAGAPLTGQLAKTSAFKLWRNGVDVTTSAVWSIAIISGTFTASIGAATGQISLNSSSGSFTNGIIRITAVYLGTTRNKDAKVTREDAVPTNSGGSNPTSSSGAINGAVNSTTLVGISVELTVAVAAIGQVQLDAPYSFYITVDSGALNVYCQWYEWNGSAYVALGTESQSVLAALYFSDGFSFYDGGGLCSFTKTGLTANSTGHKYKLFGRCLSGTIYRYFNGIATAVGT